MQRPALGVVPRLIQPERGEIDSFDGGGVELVHVRDVERADPVAVTAHLGHHHRGALLAAGIRLGQPEEPPELLVVVAEEPGLVCLLGRGTEPGDRGVVAQRAGQQQAGRVGPDRGPRVPPAQRVGRRVVEGRRQLALLRQHHERRRDAGRRPAVRLVVHQRVVVVRDPLQRAVVANPHVVVTGIFEEILEGAVGLAAEDPVVQIHAEPAGAVAIEPDLGVLALRAFGMVQILPLHVLGDPVVVPLEDLVRVAGDRKRPRVLVVARDVLVDREQQREPAAEEQISVGADRVALQSPRLDPVGGPAKSVVVALEPVGNLVHHPGRVVRAFGVVANLGQPVDGAPVGGIAAGQPVGDFRVDLAPGRSLVGHQQERIRRKGQIEAAIAQDDGSRVAIPPLVRDAGRAPVVVGGRLLPEKLQPAAGAPIQRRVDRSRGLQRERRSGGRRLRQRRNGRRRQRRRPGRRADSLDEVATRRSSCWSHW